MIDIEAVQKTAMPKGYALRVDDTTAIVYHTEIDNTIPIIKALSIAYKYGFMRGQQFYANRRRKEKAPVPEAAGMGAGVQKRTQNNSL